MIGMSTVGMHEAMSRLSQLVQEVESGGEVIIARHGRPVARLVRFEADDDRGHGAMVGRGRVDRLRWRDVRDGDAAVAAMFDASG